MFALHQPIIVLRRLFLKLLTLQKLYQILKKRFIGTAHVLKS